MSYFVSKSEALPDSGNATINSSQLKAVTRYRHSIESAGEWLKRDIDTHTFLNEGCKIVKFNRKVVVVQADLVSQLGGQPFPLRMIGNSKLRLDRQLFSPIVITELIQQLVDLNEVFNSTYCIRIFQLRAWLRRRRA